MLATTAAVAFFASAPVRAPVSVFINWHHDMRYKCTRHLVICTSKNKSRETSCNHPTDDDEGRTCEIVFNCQIETYLFSTLAACNCFYMWSFDVLSLREPRQECFQLDLIVFAHIGANCFYWADGHCSRLMLAPVDLLEVLS